jgi:hypothetical protein
VETFLHRNGENLGPYSFDLLKAMYACGELAETDLAWNDSSQTWRPVAEFFCQTVPAAPPVITPPARQFTQMDMLFLDEGGITVTKTRFVAGARTFAMAGITSVRGVRMPPSRGGPMVLLLFGVLLLIIYIGIPMIIGAIVWMVRQKPTFSVVLTTAGGEVAVYSSANWPFVARVLDALTQAIIARG